MRRSAWSVLVAASATFAIAGSGVGMGVVACAPADPAEIDPAIDPAMPSVDASSSARPAEGTTEADAGAADASKKDGGKPPPPPKDAGPDDAAPGVARPAAGEVLVTEVMYNPFGPEPGSEWFEVHNKAASARALSGLTITDGSGRTHVIGAGVVIDAGAYVVIARDKATAVAQKVPAGVIVYAYGAGLPDNAGVLLLNGATGKVSLSDGATTITESAYGGWYSQSGGSSVQLKVLEAAASAQQASWCLSLSAWTTGSEKGTPGAPSDCP